jgi:hypothetical protein
MPSQINHPLKEMPPKNIQLLTYLYVMYFLGYLPVSWGTPKDLNENGNFFRNSTIKSFIMILLDFALVLICINLFYVWHLVFMGKDFDLSLIWTPSYIVGIYDGVVTTALSQLFFRMFPTMLFWIYTYIGK